MKPLASLIQYENTNSASGAGSGRDGRDPGALGIGIKRGR